MPRHTARSKIRGVPWWQLLSRVSRLQSRNRLSRAHHPPRFPNATTHRMPRYGFPTPRDFRQSLNAPRVFSSAPALLADYSTKSARSPAPQAALFLFSLREGQSNLPASRTLARRCVSCFCTDVISRIEYKARGKCYNVGMIAQAATRA